MTLSSTVAVVLVGALLLAGCGFIGRDFPTYRYRLSIEVDTPQGPRTGTGVFEVRTHQTGRNFPASPNHVTHRLTGEAVALDLPTGTVFALLSHGGVAGLMPSLHRDQHPEAGTDYGPIIATLIRRRETFIVPRYFRGSVPEGYPRPSGYPLLVRFRDEADPGSVAPVDPDDLAASFGPGTRLRRITAQITGDPVTTEIERRLPWLRDYARRGARLSGRVSMTAATDDLADSLGTGAFSAGLGIEK